MFLSDVFVIKLYTYIVTVIYEIKAYVKNIKMHQMKARKESY